MRSNGSHLLGLSQWSLTLVLKHGEIVVSKSEGRKWGHANMTAEQ